MDFLDYREKLGIWFCDNEKYKFFLVKIFNILGEIALDTRFCGINASEYREFCRITGTEVEYKLLSEFIGPAGYRHWLSILRRVRERRVRIRTTTKYCSEQAWAFQFPRRPSLII